MNDPYNNDLPYEDYRYDAFGDPIPYEDDLLDEYIEDVYEYTYADELEPSYDGY